MDSDRRNNWPIVQLGEVAEITVGFAFKSDGFSADPADVRLLRGDNIGQGRLRWDGAKRWPHGRASDFQKYDLASGDTVLAMDRPWIEAGLKYAIVRPEDLPSLLVQRVARLRGTPMLTGSFLPYVIGSPTFTNYVNAIQTGTAVPHISGSQIAAFELPLPSNSEQTRIASVLGALDDKIDSNRRLAALLEETAAELFRARFVDFVGVEELQDSEIGRIPKGWSVAPAGDVLPVVGGSTPSTSEPTYWDGDQWWATPKDLSGLETPVILRTSRQITRLGVEQISSRALPARTVLLSSRAPVGYTAIAAMPLSINQGFIAIPPVYGVPPEWVLFWLRSNMETIKANAGGTTFAEISKKAFRPIRMAVPPREVLADFGEVAAPSFDQIISLEAERRTLVQIRDLLLPKLISGHIQVPETSDQEEAVGTVAEEVA